MDPISAVSFAVTIGTCINEIVDLGTKIQKSIEKISKNNSKLKMLSEDILSTIHDLQDLHGEYENDFKTSPQLARAIVRLHAEMTRTHARCTELLPSLVRSRKAKVKAKLKAFLRRDDIEEEIQRLKEHVSVFYAKFNVFSSARTEITILRIEHEQLVSRSETRCLAQQFGVLFTRNILDSLNINHIIQNIEYNMSHERTDSIGHQVFELSNQLEHLDLRLLTKLDNPDDGHVVKHLCTSGVL